MKLIKVIVVLLLISATFAKKRKIFSFSLSEDALQNSYYAKVKSEPFNLISNLIVYNNQSNIFAGQLNIIKPVLWTLFARAIVTPEKLESQTTATNSYKIMVNLNSSEPNSLIAVSNSTLKLLPDEGYDLSSNISFAINQSVSGEYQLNLTRSSSCPYICLNHSLITQPSDTIQFTSFVNHSKLEEATGNTINKTMIAIDLKSLLWPFVNSNLRQTFHSSSGFGYESMNVTNFNWDASVSADWSDYPKKIHHKTLNFNSKNNKWPTFSIVYQNEEDKSVSLTYTDLTNGFCDLTKDKC